MIACFFLSVIVQYVSCEEYAYTPGNQKYIQDYKYEEEQSKLSRRGEDNPIMEKAKQINKNVYTTQFDKNFKIGIILDPCKANKANCCQDVYGVPTYKVAFSEQKSESGTSQIVNEYNESLLVEVSRFSDRYSRWDSSCLVDDQGKVYRKTQGSNGQTANDYSDPSCVDPFQGLAPMESIKVPACMDNNSTINALNDCLSIDGMRKSYCVAVAYTQTAYIVQCGNQYSLDNHCGTFLELHALDNLDIISQTRLLSEYTNGYRTTTLPLFYKGDRKKTVCKGNYEIWWVQRTKFNFVIQFTKKFYVSEPQCDFDSKRSVYKDYHTIA